MVVDRLTFRDHTLSLYQSAVETVARTKLNPSAPSPGLENDLVRAGTAVAKLQASNQALPTMTPPGIPSAAWDAARLAFDLLQARLFGNTARAAAIENELQDGQFDPGWANTIAQYAAYYFGPNGTRRSPDYIPVNAGMRPLPFNTNATIALVADWGTGTGAAASLLGLIAAHKPDIVIHLGDIYYSGTPEECDRNFARLINSAFDRKRVTVYNLAGNHDMYSGGSGYYSLLTTINPPPLPQQPASFFCLRSTDNKWQFVAMDTGHTDYDPLTVTDVLVKLEPAEEDWLTARIAEFGGKTILLSHHQLFSAFAQIGPGGKDGSFTAYNPNLDASFQRFAGAGGSKIAAWFWGHEHTLTLYGPHRGLARGRCIGHGAIPVLTDPDPNDPRPHIVDPPPVDAVSLGVNGQIYMHGFVILNLAEDGSGTADYYQESSGNTPLWSEPL